MTGRAHPAVTGRSHDTSILIRLRPEHGPNSEPGLKRRAGSPYPKCQRHERINKILPMHTTAPVLRMLCGKIASGKPTLAARLANRPGTVLIVEDHWLSALFADQLFAGQDYVR